MKSLLTLLLSFSFFVTCRAQEFSTDASTMLLLHFNNSLKGAANEIPRDSAGVYYEDGKFGKALRCSSNTVIHFDTLQNINTKQGTIEFWVKPEANPSGGYMFDMRTTNGLFVEVGYWTSMYINTLPANPNPEVSVVSGGDAWYIGQWYHLAFTWGNGQLKMYVNGALFRSTVYNFDLSPVPLSYFSLGSGLNGNPHYLGLLDEFRISSRARTASEICSSYMLGLGNFSSVISSPASISLRKGWNIYLDKPTTYMCPQIKAVYGNDTVPIGAACISWTVADTSIMQINYATNTVKAKTAGNTLLIGSINSQTFGIPVQITANPFPEEHVSAIDPFLSTAAACNVKLIPTAAYIYLPTTDGVNIDVNEVSNVPQTIAQVKQRVLECSKFTKFSLEEGSKFRGYQNAAALPYVGYQIVEYVFVYEPLPRGFKSPDNRWYADFNQIMERFNGKKLVDTMGVKEVWVYGYDIGEIAASESNMSSPVTGDISNSYRIPDDLPIYNNSYVLYNYNIQRGGNEAVHNHGHQFESMIDYINQRQDGNTNLFENNFRGYNGGPGPLGRAGDTHHPPNTMVDYDYCNSSLVASDIFDWKPAGGSTTMVNCNSWSSIPYNWPAGVAHDANSNWFILWMQSFPGNGNQIPYNSNWMTNWWRFLADWNAVSINTGLYAPATALSVSLCNPYETKAPGNWNNPATWLGNSVPPNGKKVIIKHPITININATVSAMEVQPGGNVQVVSGVSFEQSKDR